MITFITSTGTRESWLQRLEEAIPCGPILNYAEALSTPQAAAREMALDVDHPTLGKAARSGTPLKMSATPLNPRRRAPLLGEHTDEVLFAGLQRTTKSISCVRQGRAIGFCRMKLTGLRLTAYGLVVFLVDNDRR